MRRPSGDHAGLESSEGDAVSRISGPAATALTNRCWPWPSPSQANATWFPSGENAGVDSDPGSAVNGATLIGGGCAEVPTHSTAAPKPATPRAATAYRVAANLLTLAKLPALGSGTGDAAGLFAGSQTGSDIRAIKR